MSLEAYATVDAYCDGKGCTTKIHDGDYVYCQACAGASPTTGETYSIREWVDDNAITLLPEQAAFMEQVVESFETGLALAMIIGPRKRRPVLGIAS